jgi:hypothetical protein
MCNRQSRFCCRFGPQIPIALYVSVEGLWKVLKEVAKVKDSRRLWTLFYPPTENTTAISHTGFAASLQDAIVGRDRLFEPGNVVGLELLGKLDSSGNLKRAVRRCCENRSVSYTRAII